MKKDDKTNKIYLFAYDEMANIEFFTRLFGLNVTHEKARLTGFIKCVNRDGNFFIKKDTNSFIEGMVFEISKEQLFLADKWKLMPIYDRFLVNVQLIEKNEILENVYVYSKIETSEYKIVTKSDEEPPKNISFFQNFMNFLSIQNEMNKYDLYDFLFVYKVEPKIKAYYENVDNPVGLISFKNTENHNEITTIPSVIVPFEINGNSYLSISVFNRNDYFNAIQYYEMFYQLNDYAKIEVQFTSFTTNINLDTFKNTKPDFILSLKEDKNISTNKYAEYEKAFELVVPEFKIEHWERFNDLVNFFFNKVKK
ncbi:hypothetical protein DA803_02940 [[Mycoplasma] phocae]|uniref:Uncharacterized protein n=1 Tax=[Mycoplasma] phocae TaxID=142651 RepID=A0A2Z5IQI8_9BACT|nr:gamma-glutamylcyclotransferase family protein [[Mycoplasma] phocae]AXE61025.1 hypothetical protein DA803_02940 [[Mycoplasma] phocae]